MWTSVIKFLAAGREYREEKKSSLPHTHPVHNVHLSELGRYATPALPFFLLPFEWGNIFQCALVSVFINAREVRAAKRETNRACFLQQRPMKID
jgi:hypothetical protein